VRVGNRASTPQRGASRETTPPLGPALATPPVLRQRQLNQDQPDSTSALPNAPHTAPPARIAAVAAHTPELQPNATAVVAQSAGYESFFLCCQLYASVLRTARSFMLLSRLDLLRNVPSPCEGGLQCCCTGLLWAEAGLYRSMAD
jgi:hypothetical protein